MNVLSMHMREIQKKEKNRCTCATMRLTIIYTQVLSGNLIEIAAVQNTPRD